MALKSTFLKFQKSPNWGRGGGAERGKVIWKKSKRTATFFRETFPQFLAFPSTINTSFSAIPRLTHGWKSWRAHCLTFALTIDIMHMHMRILKPTVASSSIVQWLIHDPKHCNRLTKSASSPDCPNLPILSPLTVGRVRGWQDILLKVFES